MHMSCYKKYIKPVESLNDNDNAFPDSGANDDNHSVGFENDE